MVNKISLSPAYLPSFRADSENIKQENTEAAQSMQNMPYSDQFNKMVEEQQKAVKNEESRRKKSMITNYLITGAFLIMTGLTIAQYITSKGGSSKPIFRKYGNEIPDWKDDCVNSKVKQAIEEKLNLKSKSKEVREHIGIKDKATFFVFFGAPGTGKTLSGKIVAKALDAKCAERQFADYSSIMVGETAVNITKDYKNLKKLCDKNPNQEFVYIVNECDALFNNVERLGVNNEHLGQNRTAQINGLDLVKDCPNLTIIFTTNVNPHSAKLDPALLSRMKVVEIGRPNQQEQLACIKYILKQYPIAKDLLKNESKLNQIAEILYNQKGTQRDTTEVIESALKKFGASVNDTSAQISDKEILDEINSKEIWAASIGKDDPKFVDFNNNSANFWEKLLEYLKNILDGKGSNQ